MDAELFYAWNSWRLGIVEINSQNRNERLFSPEPRWLYGSGAIRQRAQREDGTLVDAARARLAKLEAGFTIEKGEGGGDEGAAVCPAT